MSREKKSKVDDVGKLRKVLDNSSDPNIKKLISPDEKALDSIRRRLAGDALKTIPHYDRYYHTYNPLEPKVTIHPIYTMGPRSITILPRLKLATTPPEFESVSPSTPAKSIPSQKLPFTTQELYEVEKIEIILPEPVDDSNLPEWQPVEETQPEQPISPTKSADNLIPEFQQGDIPINSKKVKKTTYLKPSSPKEEPTEALVQFMAVESLEPQLQKLTKKQEREAKKIQKIKEKETKQLKKLELKKLKRETQDKERDAKRIIKEQQDTQQISEEKPSYQEPVITDESPAIKVDLVAYKGIKSIDEKTAELLYTNGYFSIENLKDSTVDDLASIRGIKRKLAKQIKKEIEEKIIIPEETEFVPIKQKRSAKKPKKKPGDSAEWESYSVEKTIKKPSHKSICTYKEYTLYQRKAGKHRGKKTTIHFFSKEKPNIGHPVHLPEGYQIAVNKKTGMPYLKKKK
jgi:hypothetical protein